MKQGQQAARATKQSTPKQPVPSLKIGEILVRNHGLKPGLVPQVLRHAEARGKTFGETAVRLKLVTRPAVQQALAEQFKSSYIPPKSKSRLSRELVTLFYPQSVQASKIRALRTRITLKSEHLAFSVNSAAAGEGRSYLAANLAVAYAQLGKRTLLVDTDFLAPRQQRIFGLGRTRGLSEILAQRFNGGAHIFRLKALQALSILPAGASPPNAEELLTQESTQRLFKLFAKRYEVLIFDTSNGVDSSVPEWLANVVGQSLLVTKRSTSVARETYNYSKRLGETSNMLGVVFNQHKKQ